MIRRHMCSFNDTATTEIYTLALHDALPILSLPIRYEYAGKHFGFSLGPVINLNTKSSLKTRYRVDGKKHKDTTNDLKTNLLTIDLMGTVTLCSTTFYVKYSPGNIFKKDYGPQFKTFSFGIYL